MTGQSVHHYRVIRGLGSGGMGEVFLALDTKLDRQVALKLLPKEVASDSKRRERFISEARAASALNHPNVCVIHEVGETEDGRPFIAMEFIEGQTLDDPALRGTLTLPQIVDLAVQAADGLDAAHTKGVVHRDIKPSNLSLNLRGQLKILDFGLAKRTKPADGSDPEAPILLETQAGTVMGTPSYMSPEQALGRVLDGRSDVFSLGVVLYQLATGRSPFAGASFGDTINNIVNLHPEPAGRLNPSITLEFDRIVRKCLEKQAADRYQTAHELLEDLKNHQRELAYGPPDRAGHPPAHAPIRTGATDPLSLDSLEGVPTALTPAEVEVLDQLKSDRIKSSDIFISCARGCRIDSRQGRIRSLASL